MVELYTQVWNHGMSAGGEKILLTVFLMKANQEKMGFEYRKKNLKFGIGH